ncbi:MAG: hypothetical protein U0V70_16025 [Terriglobia bacterium]
MEKALLQFPGSTELQYRLASAYLMQGLPLKAQPILEEAYQRGLRNVVVVMSLAQARFLSEGMTRRSCCWNLLSKGTPLRRYCWMPERSFLSMLFI